MSKIICAMTLVIAGMVVTGCASQKPPETKVALKSESPQTLMVRVAKQAQSCWFKKNDPALRPYKMATELDSYSGRPRVLIVPKNNPGGLPKLVVQAEKAGGQNRLEVFGPLLEEKEGPALNRQVRGWAAGARSCQA